MGEQCEALTLISHRYETSVGNVQAKSPAVYMDLLSQLLPTLSFLFLGKFWEMLEQAPHL